MLFIEEVRKLLTRQFHSPDPTASCPTWDLGTNFTMPIFGSLDGKYYYFELKYRWSKNGTRFLATRDFTLNPEVFITPKEVKAEIVFQARKWLSEMLALKGASE